MACTQPALNATTSLSFSLQARTHARTHARRRAACCSAVGVPHSPAVLTRWLPCCVYLAGHVWCHALVPVLFAGRGILGPRQRDPHLYTMRCCDPCRDAGLWQRRAFTHGESPCPFVRLAVAARCQLIQAARAHTMQRGQTDRRACACGGRTLLPRHLPCTPDAMRGMPCGTLTPFPWAARVFACGVFLWTRACACACCLRARVWVSVTVHVCCV